MPTKHRFTPRLEQPLEQRVVLNATTNDLPGAAVLGQRVPAYVIGSDGRGVQRKDSASSRVSDMIDRAFDSFTIDYLQAQAAYLSAPTTNPGLAKKVMETATTQRVNLLSQQLVQILARVPGSLKRGKGQSGTPLQSFLNRRISSTRPRSGSLLQVLLNQAIPPSPGVSDSTATLYTLAASNAVESARVATVNAAKFMAAGTFAKKH